jgi:hypothetical protein
MATQGKCEHCQVRYVWKGSPLVRYATCPQCSSRLKRTTYNLKWPVVHATPIITPRRPEKKE